jgi:predicted DCC family thiol-disulfide oxidoreductase YuxK
LPGGAPQYAAYVISMDQIFVWYDGACPLCIREIALMRRLDRCGAIKFINVADESTTCPIDRNLLMARLHASESGKMLSGAAAFAAMWRAIPLLRPLGLLARNTLILGVLEFCYSQFLRIRPLLQKMLAARQRP